MKHIAGCRHSEGAIATEESPYRTETFIHEWYVDTHHGAYLQ